MILTQDEKQENCSSGVLVGGRGFQIVKQETGLWNVWTWKKLWRVKVFDNMALLLGEGFSI